MNRGIETERGECCVKPPETAACSCSYADVLDTIGKKWAVVVLNLLHCHGRLGYNALLTKMTDITPKAFGDKLKLLQEKGLIARNAADGSRRVFYELTPAGKLLLDTLAPLFDTSTRSHLPRSGLDD
jgi:DNA-binding HxlR family transcriptional regulator